MVDLIAPHRAAQVRAENVLGVFTQKSLILCSESRVASDTFASGSKGFDSFFKKKTITTIISPTNECILKTILSCPLLLRD